MVKAFAPYAKDPGTMGPHGPNFSSLCILSVPYDDDEFELSEPPSCLRSL